MKVSFLTLALAVLILAGCASASLPLLPTSVTRSGFSTAESSQAQPPAPLVPPTARPMAGLPITATQPVSLTLRLWLPPQFDPSAETVASQLLHDRLMKFTRLHPGVTVEVRVKAEDGPGGILDSLTTASAAAPLALPDLIAMPNSLLEIAALKGLIHSLDGLTTTNDESRNFAFANQLAHLQDSVFGLPIAGDLLVLAYRPEVISRPPVNWDEVLEANHPLVFAAADPLALFTLALYQSDGGVIQDDTGRPYLDQFKLSDVLSFYDRATRAGLLPYWIAQYQGQAQAWEAMAENRTDQAVTWSSYFLQENLPGVNIAAIPTADGRLYSLATGWVWAVASPRPEHLAVTIELAEFLTESSFLAGWTEASGYIPPRPDALQTWGTSALVDILTPIATSASLYPPPDLLASLGPPLKEATSEMLKQQSTPEIAAQAAANSLLQP